MMNFELHIMDITDDDEVLYHTIITDEDGVEHWSQPQSGSQSSAMAFCHDMKVQRVTLSAKVEILPESLKEGIARINRRKVNNG